MRWGSGIAVDLALPEALAEAATALSASLDGAAPDLVVAFVAGHHASDWNRVPETLARRFPRAVLVGCSAGGVIGAAREVEHEPAVALSGATLARVRLTPFRPEGTDGIPPADRTGPDPSFLVLADPFTCDAERLLAALDFHHPGAPKIGGLSSGTPPGEGALFLGGEAFSSGAVGLALSGDLHVDALVAQGCRPIGVPLFVTRARHNVVFELDGRRAVDVLEELHGTLPPRDRTLFRHSLFLGLVMDPARTSYRQGDFLVRNLVGVDTDTGAIGVAAPVATNQVVQFHLRDAATSAADLDELLARAAAGASPPSGALLFSCVGRGSGLYGHPNHDSDALRRHLGPVPVAGFFCNGELGPVAGRTFLHGYTTCIALFRRGGDR